MYAKALGLQYLRPSSLQCFLYLEGTITLAVLLALAELVDWWVVGVLPLSVAAMVKFNDVIAGAALPANSAHVPKVRGRASVPVLSAPASPSAAHERVGSPAQRARQAATRRYE
jgi:hypothetical protein